MSANDEDDMGGQNLTVGDPIGDVIQRALALNEEDGPALYLGSVTPWLSADAMEAVGRRYNEAVRRAYGAAGFEKNHVRQFEALSLQQYLRAVREIEKLSNAVRKGNDVFNDSPALRVLIQNYDPDKHTEGPEGYFVYLSDLHAPLGDKLADAGVPVRVPEEVRRRHSYIVGSTGSGKSELLKAIIYEEFLQDNAAIVILDPHTTLAERVAKLPEIAGSGRLIYVSANLAEGYSVTINPLEVPPSTTDREKERLAFHLAASLDSLAGGTATSRMMNFLEATLRVLLDREGSTLMDLYRLTSTTPPADLVALGQRHPDMMVRDFFLEDLSAPDMQRALVGIRARLRSMLRSTDFRALTCGPSTIDLDKAISEKKVIAIALGSMGGVVGRDVGKLIMTLMTALGERRKVVERLSRNPVHVVVDECEAILTDATVQILDELRKFGVHLTLCQHRAGADMSARIKAVVLESPAVKMCGQTENAEEFLKQLGVEDMKLPSKLSADANVPLFQFICRWGRTARPFILNVRNDLAQRQVGARKWTEVVAEQLRDHYRQFTVETLGVPIEPASAPGVISSDEARPERRFDIL